MCHISPDVPGDHLRLLSIMHIWESGERGLGSKASEEDLGVRGDPGISSSLATGRKCLPVLATDIPTLVHIIWQSILILSLISLMSD